MLVVTRKAGERILIETPEGDLYIDVCRVRSGLVRLGFSGPKWFRILRTELLENGGDDARRGNDDRK